MSPTAEYTEPKHLGEEYNGAWYLPDIIPPTLAEQVKPEVYTSGLIEDIREAPNSSTNQIYRRLVIDLSKEHDFPRVEELGRFLGTAVVGEAAELFPAARNLTLDEAAIQIYPAGTELPLGWHFDNRADGLLVISATIAGSGEVSFTDKRRFKNMQPSDITACIKTQALSALVIRANGLYIPSTNSDIRRGHAVTKIHNAEDRFTIQFRQGVNSAEYGNVPVNKDRKYVGGLRFE